MLPDPTIPASLAAVLESLRWVFTAPSFGTFAALVSGLVTSPHRDGDGDADRGRTGPEVVA